MHLSTAYSYLIFLLSIISGLFFPFLNNSAFTKLCISPYLLEFICGVLPGYYFKRVKNPPAEQVALEPTPIRGLTFVHS